MAALAKVEQTDEQKDAAIWHRWKSELDYALKDKEYKAWCERSDKIVKRYRDQRPDTVGDKRRFNILWSNVETLKPAILARPPKALAERRFLDRDPVGRTASMILERCLNNQIEQGYLFESAQQGVTDHLLAGMGVLWPRYEPQFEPAEAENDNEDAGETEEDEQEEGDGTPYQRVSSERVCVDYVFWKDFLWGPARFWNERPWVARRVWKTTSEIAEEYYKGDMAKARKIKLDYSPNTDADDEKTVGYFKKAELWQFWNLADRTVYTIGPGTPDIVLQQEKEPVLKLENFWPPSRPAFATQTNDTIVPVPDYIQYQDQAQELDDLTNRIAALTTALRVSGVYDASVPALARLLQDGADNKLIPVDQWAMFAEKGGIPGAISLLPLKEIADTLIGLHEARAAVKQDLYEITGMSDIMRGQGEASATATQDRIKAQFGSMRLEARRGVINEWLLSTIKTMAEIIAEMFQEDTLLKMSGWDLKIADDVRKAVKKVPKPPEPEQPQMPEGAPPPDPQQQQQMQMAMEQAKAQGQAVFQQTQQQVAAKTQAEGMKEFQDAVALLKSDKMRGFRVDIETDSTIVADAQADKEGATELVTGVMGALTEAGPIVQMAPEFMRPIGEMLMWAFRKFRVGRSMEATLEDALDQINDRIEGMKDQPPPPDPEVEAIKAKTEAEQAAIKAKTEAELAKTDATTKAELAATQSKTEAAIAATNAKAAADAQRQRDDAARAEQQHQHDMETKAMERQSKADQHAEAMSKASIDKQNAQDEAGRKQTEHSAKMSAQEQQHRQQIEKTTTEAKAKKIEKGGMDDGEFEKVVGKLDKVLDAVTDSNQQIIKAIKTKKKVTTPDGRTYVSEPVED